MRIVLLLLLLFSIPALLTTTLKRKFEETLAPTVLGITLFLILGGVFDLLLPSYYIVIAILIACALGAIFFAVKDRKEFAKNMFTPGFFVLLIWIIVIFATQVARRIVAWDEFTHWGLTIKAMNFYDKLGSFSELPIVYRDYPPASAVFSYFFTKFTGFTEPYMLNSFAFMILSMLIVGMKNISWKKIKGAILYLILVPVVPLLFFYQSYSAVLIDPMICVTIAYIFIVMLLEDKYDTFKIVAISLGLAVLTLLKSTGLLAAVIIALYVMHDYLKTTTGDGIIENIKQLVLKLLKKNKNFSNTNNVIMAFIVLVSPIVAQVVWSAHTAIVETGAIFSTSSMTLPKIIKALTGNGLKYQNTCRKNFFVALFDMKLYGEKFTFITITMILLLLTILLAIVVKSDVTRKRLRQFNIVNHIWGFVYILFTLVAYMFTFREGEAIELTCFDRYVSIFPAGTAIVLVVLALNYALSGKVSEDNSVQNMATAKKVPVILCVTAVFVVIFVPVKVIVNHYSSTYVADKRIEFEEKAAFAKTIIKPEDRVFLVAQNSNGFEYFLTKYYLLPADANSRVTFDIGNSSSVAGTGREINTASRWAEVLKNNHYQYVFLVKFQSTFWTTFDEIFDKSGDYLNARLFKVDTSGETLKLVPIFDTTIEE